MTPQTRIETKSQRLAEAQSGEIVMFGIQQEIVFSRDQGTRDLEHS